MMDDFPVYDMQTRSYQKRTIKHGRDNVWVPAWQINANRYGMQESVLAPLQWPATPYLPYIEAGRKLHREPRLIMLMEEIKSYHPSYTYAPLLLSRAELNYLATRFTIYPWPNLLFDKVCWRCGGVKRVGYDEEMICC